MTATDLFIVLGGLGIVIVAVALVPAIIQVRRTYAKAETFIDSLNKEIGPLCEKLGGAAGELEILSASLTGKIEQTDRIIGTLQHSADTLMLTSNMVQDTMRPLITNLGGITAGVRAFGQYLFRPRN